MKKTQFVALFGVVAFGGAALLGPSAARLPMKMVNQIRIPNHRKSKNKILLLFRQKEHLKNLTQQIQQTRLNQIQIQQILHGLM